MKVVAPIFSSSDSRVLTNVVVEMTADEFAGLQGVRGSAVVNLRPYPGQEFSVKTVPMLREQLEEALADTTAALHRAEYAVEHVRDVYTELQGIRNAAYDQPPTPGTVGQS